MSFNPEEGGSYHLEQFCLLAKTQKGRACVALIHQVLNNPKIFVFGELLAMENLQTLRGTEHEPALKLLELFAYGTYSEYKKLASSLPELSTQQAKKLKQLSIISLAQSSKLVPYSVLQAELGIQSIRDLEDLIIESIYTGLVKGKLNQQEEVLKVKSCISRDVQPGQLDQMLEKLNSWKSYTEQMLGSLQECIDVANDIANKESFQSDSIQARIETLKKEVSNQGDMNGIAYEEMDIDRPRRQGARGKRGYPSGVLDHGSMARGAK